MKIDKALISHLEKLSRLNLSEKEKSEIMEDFSKILGMVQKLDELDLSDVEPLRTVNSEPLTMRKDEVKKWITQQQALSNAPDTDGVYFKVPKVIKKQ